MLIDYNGSIKKIQAWNYTKKAMRGILRKLNTLKKSLIASQKKNHQNFIRYQG